MAVTIITKTRYQNNVQGHSFHQRSGGSASKLLRMHFELPDENPGGSAPPVAQIATINVDGTFSYHPIPADVANIGKFQQEWEVTYPTNQILTFPNNGYNMVKIMRLRVTDYSFSPCK